MRGLALTWLSLDVRETTPGIAVPLDLASEDVGVGSGPLQALL